MGDMSSLYSEDAAPKKQEATPSDKEQSQEDENSETAIVPTKMLEGAKEGEEVVFKVVKIYDDEAEIAYAPAKPSEKPSMSENDELDALGKEY